ncbi:MFS transporter [Alterisphingorhabdus coralli]|uniref:MFS transporter n=1 Tax=Alterisphingorhabdus coralli TaxID=3071408 RepID=A0AA97F905_9SPHN|nr:MFS transporter [Parasphingorhabdus sp. SCSIO 66989]WOE75503.1 MFS transporter [Parasphingorhabdus sp. SCSIO 66989]
MTSVDRSEKVPLLQALAYALPGLPIAWLIPPIYAILGDFYLRHTAATAAGIGTAMVVSKIVDAVTDPPVGYLSDHTKGRMGARKPWIIAGTFLSMVTFWFLFNPGEAAGDGHFLIGIILYYISYTLIKIPYRSWLGEITKSYSERSRLWGYVTIGLLLGGVIIMTMPVVLSLPGIALFDSAEFDRDMMSFIGWVGVFLMPICILPALLLVPAGKPNPGAPPKIKDFFAPLFVSRPYQMFMVGYGLSALGFGIMYSTIIVALSSYFGIADRVPLFLLFMIAVQVISIPFWERAAARYSKHQIWSTAWLIHGLIGPIFLFIEPDPSSFWILVVFGGLTSILQAPHMLVPVSIMNDIVDYDTWKSGLSRGGSFMALYTFVDKVLHAVGFGIGYYIIAAFGYDPKAGENGFWQIAGLMLAVSIVPSICFLAASFFLRRFPITPQRHKAILSRLDRRIGGLTAPGSLRPSA